MDPCPDCQRIASGTWPTRRRVSFPHLRLVLSDERDELCAQAVWACQACQRLWRESDNDYGPRQEDLGQAWDPRSVSEFLRAHADLLPEDYPAGEAEFWSWLAAEGRAFSVGLLGGGWA